MSDVPYDEIGTAAHIKREIVDAAIKQEMRNSKQLDGVDTDKLKAIKSVAESLRELKKLPGWKIVEEIAVRCMRVGELIMADSDEGRADAQRRVQSIASFLAQIELAITQGDRAQETLVERDKRKLAERSVNPDELIDPRF